MEELAEAVRRISAIPRQGCRTEFEARFTADVMAENYERLYYRLIDQRRMRPRKERWRPDAETA